MWDIFSISEKFKFDSESCWNFFNFDTIQKKISRSFASSCRIAIKNCFVFSASSIIRFEEEIIEKFTNVAKFCTRRVDRYVLEFKMIFFSLMIHSCLDSLHLRQWIFVEIRTFFWSLIVESTNAIISSSSFFDFANFVVALRCEKIISFRWRTFLTREKQHVLNCLIYEQKRKQKIFFEFKYVFSKLSCFVCDWLVKWACSFIFLHMTKRMKATFVLESKRWLMIIWFFDEFFFFCFCNLLIFYSFFNFRIFCIS